MVIRTGQTKATIYNYPNNGSESFAVVWYVGNVRKRKIFADLEHAKIHATSMVNSLSRGEAEAVSLSGEERLCYIRASQFVSEFNINLDTAAAEYRDAKRLLKGGSLLDAARFFAEAKLFNCVSKPVHKVVEEMLKAKSDEGLSHSYVRDLRCRLTKFAEAFQIQLQDVRGNDVKNWLQEMDIENRTRNNFKLAIQTLISFAKTQKYLPPNWNEMDSIPVWKVKQDEIEIFTPREMLFFLAVAHENLIPFLSIGGFAGLRSAEVERLDWSKIDLKKGYITVDAGIAKTNSRRLVPIVPNLKQWLEPRAKEEGAVITISNVPNAIQRLVDSTRPINPNDPTKFLAPQVPWKHNALRHSFCSYRLAEQKNAAQVALEAGNSPQMIFKHYRELVTEDEAKDWFSITPERVAEIRKRINDEKSAVITSAAVKVVKIEQAA
jgi:integrase